MKTIEEIRADLKELPHISQMIAAFQKAARTLDDKETAKHIQELAQKKTLYLMALARLTDLDRTFLTEHYLNKKSYVEIGLIYYMAADTIKKRIKRARLKLLKEINNLKNVSV